MPPIKFYPNTLSGNTALDKQFCHIPPPVLWTVMLFKKTVLTLLAFEKHARVALQINFESFRHPSSYPHEDDWNGGNGNTSKRNAKLPIAAGWVPRLVTYAFWALGTECNRNNNRGTTWHVLRGKCKEINVRQANTYTHIYIQRA